MKSYISFLFTFSLLLGSTTAPTYSSIEKSINNFEIKTCYSGRKNPFPDKVIKKIQYHIDTVIADIKGVEEVIPVIGPISLMNQTARHETIHTLFTKLQQLTHCENGPRIDTIRIACMSKLMVPLITESNEYMLEQLAIIDERLLFWNYAEEYYAHYFSHKNPVKWFQRGQASEARENVRLLKSLKKFLNYRLGNLVIHVNEFSAENSAQEQYEWLNKLCNHIIASAPHKKMMKADSHFEALSVLFPLTITAVEKFEDEYQKILRATQVPSWFWRNWMEIIGSTVALTAVSRSAYKNRADIALGAKSVKDSVNAYKGQVYDALIGGDREWSNDLAKEESRIARDHENALLRLYLHYAENEEKNKAINQLIINELSDKQFYLEEQLKKSYDGELNKELQNVSQELKEIDKDLTLNRDDRYKKLFCVDSLPEKKEIHLTENIKNEFTFEKIRGAVYENDESENSSLMYWQKVIIPVLTSTVEKEVGDALTSGENFQNALDNTELEIEVIVQQVLSYVPGVSKLVTKYKGNKDDITVGVVKALKELRSASSVLKTLKVAPSPATRAANVAWLKLQRWALNKSQASKLFVCTVIGYIMYKVLQDTSKPVWYVAKKIKGKPTKYDGILEALQDLTLLLNVYGDAPLNQMEPHDVGQMHYLIDKLQNEVSQVPKKYQEQFQNNVALLHAPELTAKQKYNIITDAIFNRFPFLRIAES